MKKVKYIIIALALFLIGIVACEQINPPATVVASEPDITVPDPNYDDEDDDDGGEDGND